MEVDFSHVAMHVPVELRCPVHDCTLKSNSCEERDAHNPPALVCPSGCHFLILNGIPRFVSVENYASSFGLQWNSFRRTQLDSYTHTTISRDRLTRCLGGALEIVKGKNVLEAGCGAGRFTEILLAAGAQVFACDLSSAVKANYENCHQYPDYFVCQASIMELPVPPEQFDIVVCIGVVQHTPCPEKTIKVLCSHVKPGGLLVIDHYSHGYSITRSRRLLRTVFLQMPATLALWSCKIMIACLWPFHRLLWSLREHYRVGQLRRIFLRLSPVVDYHDSYSQLGPTLLRTWALLDTHDTLTDFYKHLRSADQISSYLRDGGMKDIHVAEAGNGVEARARKPLR